MTTPEQTFAPLILESISPIEVMLGQLLASRVSEFNTSFQGHPLHISLNGLAHSERPSFQLDIEIGGISSRLFLGQSLLNEMLPGKLDDHILKKLPKDLMSAVLEDGFSHWQEILQQSFGLTFKIQGFSKTKSTGQPALSLNIEHQDVKSHVHIELNKVVLQILKAIPAHQNGQLPDIPFRVSLQKGQTNLTQNELAQLDSGDLVFLETQAGESEVIIGINRKIAYLGAASDSQVTIVQRLQIMDEHPTESEHQEREDHSEYMTNDHAQAPEEKSAAEDTGVDLNDLPVQLIFEVGEQQLSAADIQGIQTGFIFQLDSPIDQPVKIKANGKLIAKGQLVEVEGKLAARITEMTHKS